MKKLIPMTDFVLKVVQTPNINEAICLEQTDARLQKIYQYALFLKQPLQLGMFVPIDEEGNFTEEPAETIGGVELYSEKYQKAKENVLFEGFEVIGIDENHVELINNDFSIDFFKHSATIITDSYHIEYPVKLCEDLLEYNLTLSESAIKQLGL